MIFIILLLQYFLLLLLLIHTYLAFMLGCTLSNKRCMEYQAILGGVMFSLESPVSNALN